MNPVSFRCARPVMRRSDVPVGVVLRVIQEGETELRELLAREVAARSGLSAEEVEIVSGSGKKPRVEVGGNPSAEWQVSLSHTHRCFAGVLSLGRAVGVDVEWIDPRFEWEPVAAEFFPSEMAATWNQRLPPEARREFFQHWVRWEAALKCRGTGFGATHCPPAMVARGLNLFDLDLGAGHAGCVALAPA
jgi:phosphopantetheinyl transferase